MAAPLLAIFVGGRSSRMGTDKGLLRVPASDRTILETLVDRGLAAGVSPVLVGRSDPYESLVPELPRLDDEPPDAGPLGGLNASLRHARAEGRARVIAVACDMPYVTAEVLRALGSYESEAPVLAPRRGPDAPWEPMLARYDVGPVLGVLDKAIAEGRRSFQSLFRSLDVEAFPMTKELSAALRDWDTPDDVPM